MKEKRGLSVPPGEIGRARALEQITSHQPWASTGPGPGRAVLAKNSRGTLAVAGHRLPPLGARACLRLGYPARGGVGRLPVRLALRPLAAARAGSFALGVPLGLYLATCRAGSKWAPIPRAAL